LKTPEGNALLIPKSKRLLAALVANEWESMDKLVKHHALPLVCPSCFSLLQLSF
jgi:ATP synthase mitochondrial F1 complex assembly factor 2